LIWVDINRQLFTLAKLIDTAVTGASNRADDGRNVTGIAY